MVVIENMEDMESYCKSVTAKAREKKEEKKKKEGTVELSVYAKKMLSIWDKSDFGCQRPHVGELFHVLVEAETGEDVSFTARKSTGYIYDYPPYSMVVPLSNPNGHTYPLHTPFLVRETNSDGSASCAVRIRGDIGNNHGGDWRYATDEEISVFFRDLSTDSRSYIERRMIAA